MINFHTKLYDEQGNEIKTPLCKCGKVCDTCIMGVRYHSWICFECATKEAIKKESSELPPLEAEYGSSFQKD